MKKKEFQKFLCIVDRHEKTDVLLYQLFWLEPFCKLSFRCGGSKKGRVKKVVKQKLNFQLRITFCSVFEHAELEFKSEITGLHYYSNNY